MFASFFQWIRSDERVSNNRNKNLVDFIEFGELSHNYRRDFVDVLCNFFDYADLEIGDDYIPQLVELKDKMPKLKSNIRKLPSSQYVLTFSYYLENILKP